MMTTRIPRRFRLRCNGEETVTGARVFRGADGAKVELCWRDWVGLGRPDAVEIEITSTQVDRPSFLYRRVWSRRIVGRR